MYTNTQIALIALATATGLACSESDASPADETGDDGSAQAIDVQGELFEPHIAHGLGGVVRFSTPVSTHAAVTAMGEDGHEVAVPLTEYSADTHAIELLGLHPDQTYELRIEVEAEAEDGRAGSEDSLSYEAPALPDDFPPIEIDKVEDGAAPGLRLFGVSRFLPGEIPTDNAWGYVMALEPDGEVAWYCPTYFPPSDVRLTSEGRYRAMFNQYGIAEFGSDCAATRAWQPTAVLQGSDLIPGAVNVDTDSIHHELIETPSGSFITLSSEVRTIGPEDCPTYEQDYRVVADVIVEFDPSDGTILGEWNFFDLLDPCRRTDRGFTGGYWNNFYDEETADWTHGNAVVLDEARNALIVSARHSDWLVAVRYRDDDQGPAGELLWRLGAEGDFEAADGATQWLYHQHAPQVLDNGNLLVYDNGNLRPGTSETDPAALPWSRAVEYELDEDTMTARQVWAHGEADVWRDGAAWYAPFVGDADLTPADTVLVAHGGLAWPISDNFLDPEVKKSVRLVEVSHDVQAKVLWDMRIEDPATTGFTSYFVYRAEVLDTLYTTPALRGEVPRGN